MAELQLIIDGATSEDDDAYVITSLAQEWGSRLLEIAELKLFKDGKEMVDKSSVPQGVDPNSAPVYRLMRQLGVVNLARRISESVTDRQQPNGFRKVEDSSLKDTDADKMAKQCGLSFILRRHLLPDKGDYGCSFAIVGKGRGTHYIKALSPWEAWMSDNDDSAIIYSYDDKDGVERLTLFRIERDDDGYAKRVYSRVASRESDKTVINPSNDTELSDFINDGKVWSPGTNWQWDSSKDDEYDYALACESLPIVRLSTVDGQGLYEPYLPMLKRIDREVFDRLCITMMQAFRQRAIRGELPQTYTEEDIDVINGLAEAGDPIDYSKRFAMGPAALWQLPEGIEIWESQTTDTSGLQNIIASDVKQIAAVSGIPLDILSPDVQGSANGAELKRETLKFKVQTMNELDAEAIVRMIRMAMVLDGSKAASETEFEMVWKPMDTTSSLEQAQACQLLYQSGLMARRTVLTHRMGFTAQDVAEDDMNRLADQFNTTSQSSNGGAKMAAAVEPATGWDEDTKSAVDGLPTVEAELVDDEES